ncbi:unnamed protein product [Albugo candida]|uniref:Uncharacterized protein n=1 Tax=Albugo candida TaxID=65357 RepID=A0A024G9Z4_9STRA|nr:unnamed protein product [Albugo candida]|eukprot:CCI43157.1 unnamed protein product [Albugo candida]
MEVSSRRVEHKDINTATYGWKEGSLVCCSMLMHFPSENHETLFENLKKLRCSSQNVNNNNRPLEGCIMCTSDSFRAIRLVKERGVIVERDLYSPCIYSGVKNAFPMIPVIVFGAIKYNSFSQKRSIATFRMV